MDFKKEIIIFLENDGHKYARVVIELEENDVYNIAHTYVSDEYRGKGLAAKLVKEAVKFIKSHDGKIKGGCSYAAKYLEKNKIERIDLKTSPSCSLIHMQEDQK